MRKTSTDAPPRRRTVTMVGAGNVATHLALALHAAGHEIRQVMAPTYDHAQLLAARVGAQAVDRVGSLRDDVEVCILAVGDDALYDLALDLHMPHTLVVHTSGSTPIKVLAPISARHGVVWSPQTFVRDIAMDYSALPLCIEGDSERTERDLEELAGSVSRSIYRLGGEQRRYTHLAAVMVSNFGCAMNALAQQMAEAHGVDFNMLRPLAEQTLRKWDYGELWPQMTGPARRRDEKTLDMHRRMLQQEPEMAQLYDLMSKIIQEHT